MKVFIWGMGLIGASLGLRLRQSGMEIGGAVRSERSRKFLKDMGFGQITVGNEETLRALARYDILALGLNIRDCYGAIDAVMEVPQLSERLVIFDMCSSKKQICDYMEQKYASAAFVGCHPMAGKEKQGPEAAEATLFDGATVFLSERHQPSARQAAAHAQITELWQRAGAITANVPADEHDKIMAHVSHGLHLAACLVARMSGELNTDNLSASPAAGSYRDMTRIAESSGTMWSEITDSNRTHVAAWLRELAAQSVKLADEIETGTADIQKLFTQAANARQRIMRK